MSKENIKIEVEWNPSYDEGSINKRIENGIIDKVISSYISTIDDKFKKKIDELVTTEVIRIIKDIKSIQLDTCDLDKGSIKKSMTLRDYIIQKSIDALKTKVDSSGKSGYDGSSEKRTAIEWVIKDIANTGPITKELRKEIERIQSEYITNINNLVNATLGPLYAELLQKIKK